MAVTPDDTVQVEPPKLDGKDPFQESSQRKTLGREIPTSANTGHRIVRLAEYCFLAAAIPPSGIAIMISRTKDATALRANEYQITLANFGQLPAVLKYQESPNCPRIAFAAQRKYPWITPVSRPYDAFNCATHSS